MTSAHYSRAHIKGHPIHPMIVGFPIALYVVGLVTLIVYAATSRPFWYEVAMYAWFAGVATALLAAIFGMIDLFAGVPGGSRARKTGLKHMGLNVLGVLLFAGGALMLASNLRNETGVPLDQLAYTAPLVIGIVGILVTLGAGWLGGSLVYRDRVGTNEEALTEQATSPAAGPDSVALPPPMVVEHRGPGPVDRPAPQR